MNPIEKMGTKKELSPEQYAILIEKDVIEKYSPLLGQKMDRPLSPEELKMEWIKKYAVEYRSFFNQHKPELLTLYKHNPDEARDFVERGLEGNA